MPQPTLSPVAQQLYDELGPLRFAEEELGYPLAHYCEALMASQQEIADLVRDSEDGPGWSSVLDLDRSPAKFLPWLAQFVGVEVPKRLRVVEAVNLVPNPNARGSSTPPATVSGWVPRAQNSDNFTQEIVDGEPAFRIVRDVDTTGDQTIYMDINPDIAVAAGEWVGVAGEMKRAPGAASKTAQVAAISSSTFASGTHFLSDDEWHRMSASGQQIAGQTLATFRANITNASEGHAYYARRLIFVVGSSQAEVQTAIAEYFDGDSENGRWQGIRHASASELLRDESDEEFAERIKPLILARVGWERGSVGALQAAASQHLTGTKTVVFRERTPTPYTLQVRTLTVETSDPALVEQALRSVKPAGIVLDYATITGQDYLAVETGHANYAAVEAAYGSYGALESDI